MNASLAWLNDLLDPAGLTADEADRALTDAGFPLEGIEPAPGGDSCLDVEVTSNRGDCLSHLGLAREIAAATGRALKLPMWNHPEPAAPVDEHLTLDNQEPDLCPLFTAQVIRGVKVGPSPEWLVRRLEAVGQRPINNIVDITNFITFELGHPCHVFDLDKLTGPSLVIRFAEEGETLTTLDSKPRKLVATDLVVADAERAQSLAGVIGGEPTEVSASTTDVVLEMATWDPVTIRTTARRLAIRTDACHRFERGVAPAEIAFAAARAAALIVELAGGELCQGVLEDGAPIPEPAAVNIRPARARRVLGIDVPDDEQRAALERLSIAITDTTDRNEPAFACTIPAFRLDLTREIDLIEEIARVVGFARVPIAEKVSTAVRRPQAHEQAERLIGNALAALGYFETVTFSFVSEDAARPWLPPGLRLLRVDDDRRGSEPVLRPSAIPSLLACRSANQRAQIDQPGGVRLAEVAPAFAELDKPGRHTVEHRNLALIADAPTSAKGRANNDDLQLALRHMRGTIDAIAEALGCAPHRVTLEPGKPDSAAFRAEGFANVLLDGERFGSIGLIAPDELKRYDLDVPIVAADLNLAAFTNTYPGKAAVHALPHFPPMERDVTLDLPEDVRWAEVERLVRELDLPLLDAVSFVGVYRGKPVEAGRKSLTLRLRFRDADRTLRREEADPQVQRVVETAGERFGALVRS